MQLYKKYSFRLSTNVVNNSFDISSMNACPLKGNGINHTK